MTPKNHKDITALSLSLFQKINNNKAIQHKVKKLLMKASSNEDRFFDYFFQRLFNWHFYNNNLNIDNKIHRGRRTSEKRVKNLIKDIDKYIERFERKQKRRDAKKLLDAAGRLAHHIQDMSTPSHVVPVYHGLGLKDEYENYSKRYAGKAKIIFNSHRIGNKDDIYIKEINIAEHTTSLEARYSPSLHALYNLYVASAESTLEYLRENGFNLDVDDEPQYMKWNNFWREKDDTFESKKHQGFGDFGKLGNNFGKPSFRIDKTLYKISNDQYLNLYNYLLRKSVLDTLEIINYINQRSTIFLNYNF